MKKFNDFSKIKNRIKVVKVLFQDLNDDLLNELENKILNAGQMLGGVRAALKNAKSLFLMKDEDKVIGVSAIKKAKTSVVQKIFDRVGIDFINETKGKELLEFGLTLIDEEYRGMKLVDLFYEARKSDVQKNFPNAYCFCTIRSDNLSSQKAASRSEFEFVGDYQSLYGSHRLFLYRLKNEND